MAFASVVHAGQALQECTLLAFHVGLMPSLAETGCGCQSAG